MQRFVVRWEIEIKAGDAVEAATEAAKRLREGYTESFDVVGEDGESITVDVLPDEGSEEDRYGDDDE